MSPPTLPSRAGAAGAVGAVGVEPAAGGPPAAGPAGSVVLVHGVGLDGELFAQVVERLAGRAPVVVRRRGYDGRPPCADLGRHLDDLVAALDGLATELDGLAAGPDDRGAAPDVRRGRSVVVAGVSGGATLALALALRGHPALAGVVAHEPLLGLAAPAQHERITASIATLATEPGRAGVEGFLRRLVTDATWNRLPAGARQRAVAAGEAVRTEAPGFGAFAVDPALLAHPAVPLRWTVGRHSPHWRHEAAAVAAAAGITVTTLEATHTPQWEDPEGFARIIAGPWPEPAPGPRSDPPTAGAQP